MHRDRKGRTGCVGVPGFTPKLEGHNLLQMRKQKLTTLTKQLQ